MWRDISDGVKILLVTVLVLFVGGAVALSWVTIFGPAFKEQQRNQYEESQWHKDAVVQDLTDRCAELATAKDDETKKAISIVIAQRASNENLDDLRMAGPVRKCVDNAINNYVGVTE